MNRFAAAGKAAFAAALINAVLFIVSEKTGVMLDSVVIPATAKSVTPGAVIAATVITVKFY